RGINRRTSAGFSGTELGIGLHECLMQRARAHRKPAGAVINGRASWVSGEKKEILNTCGSHSLEVPQKDSRMVRSVAAAIVVAMTVTAGSIGNARADNCNGEPYGRAEPPPVYVYDHSGAPRWTGNGWAYLPIGAYRPRPEEMPPVVAPPAHKF